VSDFRVQYITGSIESGQTQKTLTAPTNFLALGSLSNAFAIPATSLQTAGYGVTSDSSQMRDYAVNVNLHATDTIILTRGNDGSAASFAFWVIEYIGPSGGANEFIMRGKRTFTFADTALTADSNAITGITSVSRCVPFISGNHEDFSTSDLRYFMVEARVYTNGSDNVIGIQRTIGTNGEPTYICYCVEFTGSNWTIKSGVETSFSTSPTTRDVTLSPAVAPSHTWVYTQYAPANAGTPAGATHYAWIQDASTLRLRVPVAGSASRLRYYVIENPDIDVGRVNVVDGTVDWSAGSSPQAQSVALITEEAGTFIAGHAGSSSTTVTDNPAGIWRFRRISGSEIEAVRLRSIGTSEYVVQAISLPADAVSTLTIAPQTAVLSFIGKTVNGDYVLAPGVGLLNIIPFGPFSEVFRIPGTATLTLAGGSVIVIAVNPAQSALSLQGRAPTLQALKVISPALPDLDYSEVNSTAPTIVLGTALNPATATLTLQSLQHAATEGGNIAFRSPAAASLTMSGLAYTFALINSTPAALSVVGLAPTITATHALLEPGVGALAMVQIQQSTDFIHIPFQWLNYDPAPVVAWA
jgi:hypothetical protein